MHILITDPRYVLFHSEAEYEKSTPEPKRDAHLVAYWCPPVEKYLIIRARNFGLAGTLLNTLETYELIKNMEKQYDD